MDDAQFNKLKKNHGNYDSLSHCERCNNPDGCTGGDKTKPMNRKFMLLKTYLEEHGESHWDTMTDFLTCEEFIEYVLERTDKITKEKFDMLWVASEI